MGRRTRKIIEKDEKVEKEYQKVLKNKISKTIVATSVMKYMNFQREREKKLFQSGKTEHKVGKVCVCVCGGGRGRCGRVRHL